MESGAASGLRRVLSSHSRSRRKEAFRCRTLCGRLMAASVLALGSWSISRSRSDCVTVRLGVGSWPWDQRAHSNACTGSRREIRAYSFCLVAASPSSLLTQRYSRASGCATTPEASQSSRLMLIDRPSPALRERIAPEPHDRVIMQICASCSLRWKRARPEGWKGMSSASIRIASPEARPERAASSASVVGIGRRGLAFGLRAVFRLVHLYFARHRGERSLVEQLRPERQPAAGPEAARSLSATPAFPRWRWACRPSWSR